MTAVIRHQGVAQALTTALSTPQMHDTCHIRLDIKGLDGGDGIKATKMRHNSC